MLVGQVTDFDSVGVAAGAGAVPQVSVFAANRCHWGGGCICIFGCVFPALRSMWEAPDVSIRPSQTRFGTAG